MSPQRVGAIVLRQFYLIRGSVSRLVPVFVWVMVDIVLWGYITRYLNSVTATMNFVPIFLGAVLLWEFFIRVMHGVTTAFFEDVWSHNFLNLFATPLSIVEYLCGLVLISVVTSTAGLTAMLLLATTVFGLSLLMYGLMLLPFFLILFVFGIALGMMGTALVLRLGPAAEWFIWPIPALISPFAGVFYPIATLPLWMQCMARAMPPCYVFEGMRAITLGQAFAPASLLAGGALATLYLFGCGWFFTSTYHLAVRSGLIARYSAESMT